MLVALLAIKTNQKPHKYSSKENKQVFGLMIQNGLTFKMSELELQEFR